MGSKLLFSRELTSHNVTCEIEGEVPLWDFLVDAWIDSRDTSALVHFSCQVDEQYASHSPSVISNSTLLKSKVRKNTW
jgi:hypothetical protein